MQLFHGPEPYMRRVPPDFHLMQRLRPTTIFGGKNVTYDNAAWDHEACSSNTRTHTSWPTNALHFCESFYGMFKVMKGQTRCHHVKRVGGKWQRIRVAQTPTEIFAPRESLLFLCLLKHGRHHVDSVHTFLANQRKIE